MKTEFKNMLKSFFNKVDVYSIVENFVNNINNYGHNKKTVKIGKDENDYKYFLILWSYSNDMCSNIEVWITQYDNEGYLQNKERICLYDMMNDSWDGLLATEEYTETELNNMAYEQLKVLLNDIMTSDVTDIICFSVD